MSKSLYCCICKVLLLKNRIIEAKLQQYQTDEYVPYVFLALLLSASIGGPSHHHLYASDIARLGN